MSGFGAGTGSVLGTYCCAIILARVLADVDICDPLTIPIYQVIAAEVAAMHDRCVRVSAIARRLAVDHHTVDKALCWFRSR